MHVQTRILLSIVVFYVIIFFSFLFSSYFSVTIYLLLLLDRVFLQLTLVLLTCLDISQCKCSFYQIDAFFFLFFFSNVNCDDLNRKIRRYVNSLNSLCVSLFRLIILFLCVPFFSPFQSDITLNIDAPKPTQKYFSFSKNNCL